MMRVLHVIGAMDRGGAETTVMNLYRTVDRDVVQFDFLVHEERTCDFDEEISDLGGRLYRVPRFNGANLFHYARLCRKVFEEHPEHRIVHGHIGSSAAVYLSEAKRAGRFAIAHSHAQFFLPGFAGLAFRAVSWPTRFVADYFFACSPEAGKDRFGQRVVDGDRFSVLNGGIDLGRYACSASERQRAKRAFGVEGRPVFGHVGRLAPEKNHAFLLEAFARIRKELPDAVLLLAGRGPLESELREQARSLGLDGAVDFLGVREDVPEVLRALDVFLLPSVKEGLALAAVEAQAVGLPCVLSTGVPPLACITDCAVRMPLESGTSSWAQRAVDLWRAVPQEGWTDGVDKVRAAGFDVRQTAAWLTDFYQHAEESRRA